MEIETVIRENGTYLYNFALKLTCNPDKAEDLVQETFIRAWRKGEQLKEEKALRKWLRVICYRQFLMYIRDEDSNLSFVEDTTELEAEGYLLNDQVALPEEQIIVKESMRELQNGCFLAMVRRLTLQQRIAFSLVDMFGLTMEEAADMLDIRIGAVKGLLYRARMNLDSFFSDHCIYIDAVNPCTCEAWIGFRNNHEQHKEEMRSMIQTIDYEKKEYRFSEKVRGKVAYLYSHMPDQCPDETWFQKIIQSVQEKN